MLRSSEPPETTCVQHDGLLRGAECPESEQGDRGAEDRDGKAGYFSVV